MEAILLPAAATRTKKTRMKKPYEEAGFSRLIFHYRGCFFFVTSAVAFLESSKSHGGGENKALDPFFQFFIPFRDENRV